MNYFVLEFLNGIFVMTGNKIRDMSPLIIFHASSLASRDIEN